VCQDGYYLTTDSKCAPCSDAAADCAQCYLDASLQVPVCVRCPDAAYLSHWYALLYNLTVSDSGQSQS
jgi:hypothetical protein